MAMLDQIGKPAARSEGFPELCRRVWNRPVSVIHAGKPPVCRLECEPHELTQVWQWLIQDLDFAFATLVVEEEPSGGWSLAYVFYRRDAPWVCVELQLPPETSVMPSVVGLTQGPSADWHEREAEDLFGIAFEGHPRLGEFILHEDWPEGVNPMRRTFDPRQPPVHRDPDAKWQPPTVVEAPGAFAMPIGPVFSDFAESAHFLLETVGEDVIRTIPRLFYKYRGVEKIAEGAPVDRVVLLAERFSGTAAFAHGLAFCQAVESICGIEVPPRARALRTMFAELERLRHHAAAITGICNSTALAVATSQAALIEETLLRLTCEVAQHRYLFGAVKAGGLDCDVADHAREHVARAIESVARKLHELHEMLRYSSSFLDRLEEVGIVRTEDALSYGLVGPVARACGIERDLRKLFPYAQYDAVDFAVPVEREGDGYARLRILFREADQSTSIIRQILSVLPEGSVCVGDIAWRAGAALSAVEAPLGAAFHWLRIRDDGTVARYRLTPPSFTNWHGFRLAAENFAFQDFPIILASFGLSNAECDR
ncbi:MAG: NADH-quinone oxidoreductase subunit C [Xanthobacteraceae bacterium]